MYWNTLVKVKTKNYQKMDIIDYVLRKGNISSKSSDMHVARKGLKKQQFKLTRMG